MGKKLIEVKLLLYPLKFSPIYMERIWGGTGLCQEFGREIPGERIGESWEISCRRDGMSRVALGPLKGRTLEELITEYGPELLGTEITMDQEFPLLLKILDAQDTLSVQVHPGDEFAGKYENSLGKTEVWYVLRANPGAKIIYGLKPGTTREQFIAALNKGRLGELLNEIAVQPGEVYPVSAGLLHSLGAGVMAVELQQNSDLTYRVFDWNRLDKQGKPRPLHVEKALQVIEFDRKPLQGVTVALNQERRLLTENEYFTLEALEVAGRESMLSNAKTFSLGMVVKGDGFLLHQGKKYYLNYGDSFMIPAIIGEYSLEGEFTLLIGTPKK